MHESHGACAKAGGIFHRTLKVLLLGGERLSPLALYCNGSTNATEGNDYYLAVWCRLQTLFKAPS